MRMPVSVCGGEMAANRAADTAAAGARPAQLQHGGLGGATGEAGRPVGDINSCARFARRVMEQTDPARIEDLIGSFKSVGVH